MKLSVLSAALCAAAVNAVTLTTSSTHYTVSADSANPLIVAFRRSNCDITSLKYRGREVQYAGKGTHISSGLGSATVAAEAITSGGTKYVKVTCTTATLIHYYVIRDGDSSLHMGTWISAQPSIGELRWILRANPDVLPNDDVGGASITFPSTSTVEGSDVFVVGGQTRSKFYSSQRFIDDKVHCLSGPDIKACMVMPGTAYESSSGGPFFRDINMNPAGDSSNLYRYMNSGHAQTEAYRMGFHGPYTCQFSRTGTPDGKLDLSFMANLGLKGWVAASARGTVKGTASGVNSKYQTVVHWYNSAAQYWTYASSSGSFTSPAMKAGTYTQVLYQGELKVATSSVTIKAGAATTANIASTFKLGTTTLFTIGEFDGSPAGFRNAAAQLRQHPSDKRMASWGPLTYTVGTSKVTDFPMAVFKSVNAPLTIKFYAAAAGAATLRIGTTLAFASGRPTVAFNGKALAVPAAPKSIDSRGVTRGAYRGNGEVYDFKVDVLADSNTFTIAVASGSSGATYLSPNFIFDAVAVFR